MRKIEEEILKAYVPYETTLRQVARIVGTDHHRVKRTLESNGIAIVKGKRGPFSNEHRRKISEACKGRMSTNKGVMASKASRYKNMAVHLRFSVSAEWLSQFQDIEKLKLLNMAISRKSGRYDLSNEAYLKYINRFYFDEQFCSIYERWIKSGKDKWKKPTLDHIKPKCAGGTNEIDNLQFLTWFENRAKCDMTQREWVLLKTNIKDYLT